MVPFCVVVGSAGLVRLYLLLDKQGWLKLSTMSLSVAFYALMVCAYLRRGPARKSSPSLVAIVAAMAGTFSPFVLPFLGSGAATMQITIGQAILAAGLAFSLWSIWILDRSFSIVPQARSLVQEGPYAHVRHPLYAGEIVALFGVAMTLGGWGPFIGWLGIVVLQSYRAFEEEKLLLGVLPEYRDYQLRTARLIPGVF
jgi:protein-S-isoprenylcysteine O-methyltransferase Ste14